VIKTRGEVVEVVGPTFEEVTGFRVNLQVMHFVPRFSKLFAENIQALFINDNFLKAIEKDDMAQFPNLKEFYAGGNDLVHLPSDLFQGSTNILGFDFNKNPLKTIGADLVTPLKKIKIIRLSNAGCINFPEARNNRDVQIFIREFKKNCSEPSL
jgi:hypothetical protein